MKLQKSTQSARETQAYAASFAKTLKPRKTGAWVVALEGNLGAGKTTFAQGFAKGLGLKEAILSPTFLIIKSYELPARSSAFTRLFHIDFYRITQSKELLFLQWQEILEDSGNIVLVEWADRIKKILPMDSIWIHFKATSKTQRELRIK